LSDSNDLIDNLKENRQLTDSIMKKKDDEIQALSTILVKLTERLSEFEGAKERPEGSPDLGVI